jgi:hypothetical protein
MISINCVFLHVRGVRYGTGIALILLVHDFCDVSLHTGDNSHAFVAQYDLDNFPVRVAL